MRRKKNPQGSFELFLDIVCNTFGGILFIAMLVAILTRMIGQDNNRREKETVPMDAVLSVENRLQTLQGEQERLRELAEQFQENASPDLVLARQMFELENERNELLKVKTAQSQKIVENIKTVAEAENLWNETLAQLEQREEQYRRKQQAFFESVVKEKLQDVRLPQMRVSHKRKVALVLMGDKLFFWHKTTPDGSSFGLNEEQFVAFDRGTYMETQPKPWTGFPVNAEPQETEIVARQLQKFHASRVAFDVVVFRDSFGSFHILRNAMVENGFEYTLFPIQEGESLVDRGGASKPVQ